MSQLPDFDATYQGRPVTPEATRVPWNIGEPQPPIAALIAGGQVSSPVLDAGCGNGETATALAARGHEVVGIDASPTAIAQARHAAQERGVAVEFLVDDITTFGGYDGHFATVIDSTLFHSLALDQREGYLAAIARAARPGATLHMLVFDRRAPLRPGSGPNAVDETELRDVVGRHWTLDAITPSSIHAWTPQEFAAPLNRDEQGRALFPAFLLRAHRAADQPLQPHEPVATPVKGRPLPMTATTILILSGSLRAAAITTQIASVAMAAAPAGVATTMAEDLTALPFYNQDLDTDDPPEAVAALRRHVVEAGAVLFVSPANNGSVSAVLKNSIDWLSRPRDAAALQGKPVALLVTGHSTETVEAHLEHILYRAGATVVPSADRALPIRSFDGKQPADVATVLTAVTNALTALAGTVRS